MLNISGFEYGFILPLILILGIFFWFRRHHKMRNAAMLELAHLLSFDYQKNPSLVQVVLPWEFELFKNLEAPKIEHLFTGEKEGIQIHLFEVSSSNRKKNEPKADTVIVFEKPSWELPSFTLQSGQLGITVKEGIYDKEIQLEDDDKFNKSFILTGQDETEVQNLMNLWKKDLLKYPLYIECQLNRLLFFKRGKLPVIPLEKHLHRCIDLTNVIDEYSPP